MRAWMFLTAFLLVGIFGGEAEAQVCDGALAVRVNQKGLDFIVQQVKPLIPTSLTIPAIDKVVVDWPLTKDDLAVQTQPMKATFKIKSIGLKMVTGQLRLQGKADVDLGGPVKVLNPYASFGSADCNANVKIRDLELDVGLLFSEHGGKVRVSVAKAYVNLDNEKSEIGLNKCSLGKVVTTVTNFLRKTFMGLIQSKVESLAKEQIPALLASKLGDSMQISKELMGYVVTGRLDSLSTDYYGITAKLGASFTSKSKTAAPCLVGSSYLTPPKACTGAHANVSPKVDAMFGAGVSQSVLNQAIYTVWHSGKLCIDSDSLKVDALTQGLDKVATLLGQPKGTKIRFSVRLLTPPTVKMTQQSGLQMFIKDFKLKLSLTPPGGPVNGAEVHADLAVAVKPWIDPGNNSIALDVKSVSIPKLQVQNKDGSPSSLKLDPARLHRFLETVALPMVRQKLSGTQLSPSIINAKVLLVEMKLFEVREGYLAAYLNGHKLVSTNDKGAPQTILAKKPAPVVGPQVLRINVRGTDNRTPAALLQFKARVDGGKWSEPSYGGLVDVVTHTGVHQVEIAAVDHDGNVDPSPVRLTFTVDDNVPQLMITSRPDSLVETDTVTVGFAGRDDRTPVEKLTYTAEVYRVPDGGGMPTLLQSHDLGQGARTANVSQLHDGLHKLRIIVKDQVGNVTSADVGFVVEAGGGCNVSGGASTGPAGLLLLALMACVALRRRD